MRARLPIPPQQESDLYQAIGMLQVSQIGEDKCSIDCLNLSMERQFQDGNVLARTAN
jgi:hypothetical protein